MRISAEWFPIILGTMVLSLVSWINSILWNNNIFLNIGKVIYFIGLILFFSFLFFWGYGYLKSLKLIKEDFNNITRVAFSAFIGVLLYIFGFFTTVYVSTSSFTINFLYYVFLFAYFLVLTVNIVVGYKLYTQNIEQREVSYALLVPSIGISANVILSAPILPPYYPYISKEETEIAYFLMLIAVGITFFQFLFIGTAAFLSHIYIKAYQTSPAVMIPLGAASILSINILTFPSYNDLGLFYFPQKYAITLAIILWGFEIWNFIVALLIAIKNIKRRMPLTVWAYVFPIGIMTFDNFMIYQIISLSVFFVSTEIFSVIAIVFYVYALYNTILFLKEKK